MKFAFVTCVQLGLTCMEEIYSVGGHLDLVITLKDTLAKKKSGRVYVDDFCSRHEIPLVKIRHVDDEEAVQAVRDHEIDWLFIIGWSQIAHEPMLSTPRRGVLGMHPTLLPEGRGRAAIPWAILKGLPETGVTLFKLDDGVDTGPILYQERIPLSPDETAATLYGRVEEAHRTLICNVWPDLVHDRIQPMAQDESKATIWEGRTPEDGIITPEMTVRDADRLVRATTHPYPGAFWKEGNRILHIWRGQIGSTREPTPDGARRISLTDGVYDALEYEEEGENT